MIEDSMLLYLAACGGLTVCSVIGIFRPRRSGPNSTTSAKETVVVVKNGENQFPTLKERALTLIKRILQC